MLKYAAAGALLLIGLAASNAAPVAAPRNDDCVNCAPSQSDSAETPARIRQEIERLRALEAQYRSAPAQADSKTVPEHADETPGAPAPAYSAPNRECADCPPPKHYDEIEVVKTSRDVDQSRVINTESVVQRPPRVREINKLVIHENEIRNVGVIQHNHKIIEKENRYVKRAPVYRQAVVGYRVVQQVQTVLVPVVMQSAQPCGCPCTCGGSSSGYVQAYTYAPGRTGQVHAYGQAYAYAPAQGAVQQVLVPVTAAYGYR